MNKEIRCVKFHLDKSVNKAKKDKIIKFLNECQTVQNKIFELYWEDDLYKTVINSKNKIAFNYNSKLSYRDFTPKLKSHHFQQILQQVFSSLKSIQSNIIRNIYFEFEDKELQAIYNYCKGFCFDWNNLETYIDKQLKKYKKDKSYFIFLNKVKSYISDSDNYNKLKHDIEKSFWDKKSKTQLPIKKEFQMLCNSYHTLDYEIKEFQWIFTIDNNDIIGGSEKKGVYDKIVIPVKYSDYHKAILNDKSLFNTFNIKLNRNGNIEIIASYEVDIDYPKNEITQEVGIDIGLKKLITSSDGEIIDQNKAIINKLNKLNANKINRRYLIKHLKTKYKDENFTLLNKRYLKREYNLTCHVVCDNRYRIKQFLKGRENFNIVMEDLDISDSKTDNKKVNNQLRRLAIQQIKNDIIKYSKIQGNKVSLINPAYTSQQCSNCNHVSKDNRKTQERFSCVKCGHTLNADYNASINILNRHYDDRIRLDMKPKEVLNILNN